MKTGLTGRVVRRLRRIDHALRPAALFERNCRFLLYRRAEKLAADAAVSAPPAEVRDEALIERIVAAYRRALQADLGDSMWKMFFSTYHKAIHHTLLGAPGPAVAGLFRNPGGNNLLYGFDILCKMHHRVFRSANVRAAYARLCLDGLVRFAEAVGAIRLDNPETWAAGAGDPISAEGVISALQKAGLAFISPNPFPAEHGFASASGVIPVRTPQALYQAWRIRELVREIPNPRVLEIGAGLGRTAYYANTFGIRDYTIVDIPVTAAAQAYFLGRTLGEDRVRLEGEAAGNPQGGVRIIGPKTFLEEDVRYDLVVNVDSLPEMDIAVAGAYWDKIRRSTPTFLSINHEANAFRVSDLLAKDRDGLSVARESHWMRRGYAEELIRIR